MAAEPRRALVVGAHPDDIEFGAAGTVATWTDAGWDVRYVIATRGQRGTQDVDADPDAFGRVREEEAREAARICGVGDVTFLDHRDSEVAYGPALLRDLSREFRLHRPHRLVALDPSILPTDHFVNHPDHRAVGEATLDITITGGTTAAIFPELLRDEGLPPWRGLEEIWVMGPAGGAHVVDVTAAMERKVAAVRAHRSQLDDPDEIERYLRERLAETGAPYGYAYGESFRVVARRR